jgi:hypothetical protein
MGELTQVIIKSGRGEGGFEYKGHYRAEIFFDRHGRECIVDDRPVLKLKGEVEKEVDALRKKLAEAEKLHGYESAAAQEHRDQIGPVSKRLHMLKTGYLEETGKPLILTQKLYEYLREANGKALMFEPWDGHERAAAPADVSHLTSDERMAALEAGQTELRGMFSQLLAELKRK